MAQQKEFLKFDFCVIGAGSGGVAFAIEAKNMGASVVLVEKSRMGGESLHSGCIPSKSLLAAAKVSKTIKDAPLFGWSIEGGKVDFKKVQEHIKSVIQTIAQHNTSHKLEEIGVKVIMEEGGFVDNATLETQNHIIHANHFIIATGSHAFIPPIDGLSSVPYYTNETIFDIPELPDHLVIIGGGPIGVEMAQAFCRLGSKVTLLEMFLVLPKDEPEIVDRLEDILRAEGVVIKEHVAISSIAKGDGGLKIDYVTNHQSESIVASHILVAAGQRPNIQSLNLEAAHVKTSSRGIEVDECLRTTNHRIYAIGDCIGGHQFSHLASQQASIALHNTLFHLRTPFDNHAIPWVTYTDPELAHVGEHAFHLKNEGIAHKVLHVMFDHNDRAVIEHAEQGEIKVMVSPHGKVLGATILGKNAGDLIYPWVMMVQNKMHISNIVHTMAPYPTLSDLNKRIARKFYHRRPFSTALQRLVRLIQRLGG